jgi:hypothetical protein
MKSDYSYSKQYPVRLTQHDIEAIQNAFKNTFGRNDHLWVFGSRADLSKKGGDIDLYVETELNSKEALNQKIKFSVQVFERIGDQKIDIVVNLLQSNHVLDIYKVAQREGIKLV